MKKSPHTFVMLSSFVVSLFQSDVPPKDDTQPPTLVPKASIQTNSRSLLDKLLGRNKYDTQREVEVDLTENKVSITQMLRTFLRWASIILTV